MPADPALPLLPGSGEHRPSLLPGQGVGRTAEGRLVQHAAPRIAPSTAATDQGTVPPHSRQQRKDRPLNDARPAPTRQEQRAAFLIYKRIDSAHPLAILRPCPHDWPSPQISKVGRYPPMSSELQSGMEQYWNKLYSGPSDFSQVVPSQTYKK